MEFSIFTFPFEQIGWGLRQLSLSGGVGNVVAIVLFVLIGVIPCVYGVWLWKREKACCVDWMLPIISACLLFFLYYMINPGLFVTHGMNGEKALLGCTFYSVLMGYVVLRIMKVSAQAGSKSLQKGLQVLLYVVMVFFAYAVAAEFVFQLPTAIQEVQEVNTGLDEEIMTYIFLVLQSIVTSLPYVLDIWVLWISARTLKELMKNPYSDESVAGVSKIATACMKLLTIVVVTSMGFNVAQLVLRNRLCSIHVTTSIPLLSVLLTIVILVLARYMGEAQKLKQDNDLFI